MGLDLSLTATGIAHELGAMVLKTPKTKFEGPRRLAHIRDEVVAEISRLVTHPSEIVIFIEGYSYNSKVGGERIGELGGVVRLSLFEMGVDYVEVQPKTLKKYATGNGNAGKDWMIAEAARRAPAEVVIRDNNEADAWWLYVLGSEVIGNPIIPMPAAQRKALDAILWPAVAV